MKVYVVKAPQGEYESYREPIDKIFLDKKKAQQYVKEENAKLPLKQAEMCEHCFFKWDNAGQKCKTRPNCYNGDKYNMCLEYFKYRDVQELFMEEYEVEEWRCI